MEGVGRMLPSQTGAATRPSTVAPMTRPQPQRLEAVVQPQQQAALRHKQVRHWHMRVFFPLTGLSLSMETVTEGWFSY